jgi:hypothetical protein
MIKREDTSDWREKMETYYKKHGYSKTRNKFWPYDLERWRFMAKLLKKYPDK